MPAPLTEAIEYHRRGRLADAETTCRVRADPGYTGTDDWVRIKVRFDPLDATQPDRDFEQTFLVIVANP